MDSSMGINYGNSCLHNAVEFWTANNRDFFTGTAVEEAVRRCLNEHGSHPPARHDTR